MSKLSLNRRTWSIPLLALTGACTIVASTDSDAGTNDNTGGSTGTGGSTATGGSAGTGGSTAGSAGQPGSGGTGVVISDAGTAGDPCTGPETVSNDDRSHATPYTLNTQLRGCVQSDSDLDFYEFTTPASPAQGGFLQVQITDVATTTAIEAHLLSAHDNGELEAAHNFTGGASAFMWFAAQPGATFRVSVAHYAFAVTQPSPYLFTVLFTGVNDTYEPNNDSAHAKPIAVNTEVSGYFFEGYLDSTPPEDTTWSDFFSVPLAVGHVKISLVPPTDATAEVLLFNPNASQISGAHDFTAGSTVVIETDLTAAGTYYVNAHRYGGPAPLGTGSTLPTFFTQPFKLTVTQ